MSSENWQSFRLTDLVEVIGGGTPRTSIPEYWNGDIPWISVVDFQGEKKYILKTEKHISGLGLQNSSTKILKSGQVIISARGTVGELAILGKDMAFNQSCYGLDANNLTSNEFVYYLLKHNINQIKQKTNGAVFDTITRETLDNIFVEIPSLKEQQHIVEVLSALDDKIELNRQTNATLEAIAQAVFKEWFVDFRYPGATGELVDSELGPIPKGWRVDNLDGFASISSGKGPKRTAFTDKGYPILGANGKIGFTNNYLIDDEVILTGRVGTIGTLQLINKKVWISDNVLIITPIEDFYYHYLYLWLKTVDFENLNRGSTQPLITKTDLLHLPILRPDVNIFVEYDRICRGLFKLFTNYNNENALLSEIRDHLLPKLMNEQAELCRKVL